MERILRALEVAIKAHGMTPRKYARDEGKKMPYVVHVVRVMNKVCHYFDAYDTAKKFEDFREPMLIVAALHDTIEDTAYPESEIEREFGTVVMDGVRWLTNPSKKHPQLVRYLRKEMDLDHLAKAPPIWQIVKMLDRIDNLYDMLGAKPGFALDVYIPESVNLLARIGGADKHVAEELQAAIDWLRIQMEAERYAADSKGSKESGG